MHRAAVAYLLEYRTVLYAFFDNGAIQGGGRGGEGGWGGGAPYTCRPRFPPPACSFVVGASAEFGSKCPRCVTPEMHALGHKLWCGLDSLFALPQSVVNEHPASPTNARRCRLQYSSLYANGCPKSGGGENMERGWARTPDSGSSLSIRNR